MTPRYFDILVFILQMALVRVANEPGALAAFLWMKTLLNSDRFHIADCCASALSPACLSVSETYIGDQFLFIK